MKKSEPTKKTRFAVAAGRSSASVSAGQVTAQPPSAKHADPTTKQTAIHQARRSGAQRCRQASRRVTGMRSTSCVARACGASPLRWRCEVATRWRPSASTAATRVTKGPRW